jgi:hypothetical protein
VGTLIGAELVVEDGSLADVVVLVACVVLVALGGVVVAGGREPSQWEAYPHHQYLHTNGALLCCDNGGCWRSRVKPLGDGDEADESLCVDPVGRLPRCMDMITAEDVIRRIELYFQGGAVRFLTPRQWRVAERSLRGAAEAVGT